MGLDHDAIRRAYPSIKTLDDSFIDYGLDINGNKVSLEQSKIDAARTTLDAEYAALEYSRNRAAEYPDFASQMDDIYHNGIDGWKATIKTIKDKYPKPS